MEIHFVPMKAGPFDLILDIKYNIGYGYIKYTDLNINAIHRITGISYSILKACLRDYTRNNVLLKN